MPPLANDRKGWPASTANFVRNLAPAFPPVPRATLRPSLGCFQFWLILIVTGIWPLDPCAGQKAALLKENELKAGILSRIPDYVTWPSGIAAKETDRFVLGILGDSELEIILRELTEGVRFRGKSLEIRVVASAEQINRCHILFVPKESTEEWQALKASINPQGLLTVGESEDFLQRGGVCLFRFNESRRVWVHLKNSENAGLEISSKFLRLTKVIR